MLHNSLSRKPHGSVKQQPVRRDSGRAYKPYSFGNLELAEQNHFVGKIPKQIGKLEWLETLDLSRNKLFRCIAPSMVSLRFMNCLKLSYNRLSGEIPTANQFQTFNDPSIDDGDPALWGDPLPKKCPKIDGKSRVPGDDEDKEDGNEHDKLWLFLSVALGFAFGFWGVCGTSIVNKS